MRNGLICLILMLCFLSTGTLFAEETTLEIIGVETKVYPYPNLLTSPISTVSKNPARRTYIENDTSIRNGDYGFGAGDGA